MSPTAVAAGPSAFFAPASAFACVSLAGAPPDKSNTTRTEWTGTTAPTCPRSSTILPDLGDVIVTVALSVITSTIGWSSVTESPGPTSHLTISPSVTPSPMSGSLNS